MKQLMNISIVGILLIVGSIGLAKKKAAPHQPVARVYFENLKDGDKVASPVKVKMGVEGLKVRVAGEAPDEKTSGHHHIIIDGSFVPEGQPIVVDDKHIHFGKGQTEVEINLPSGPHTLTLQFADGAHRSYGEKLSATVKIEVL